MNRDRTKWFEDARFGMFIHWGLYSVHGQGEWHMSQKSVTAQEYRRYFDAFDPKEYRPREWARLAKEAGMQYMILTAKHHDGFCLYDTKLTDYNATNTKAGRDLVREFVDAVREEGLKVGLYFSLLDWVHPDYPKFGDLFHPLRNEEQLKGEVIDWDNYLRFMHGQVEELCTNYGKLDLLWFDFSYGEMREERWRASELMKMVRRLQPDVIVDNRLEAWGGRPGSILSAEPGSSAGDFASPEQHIPDEGIRNVLGERIPWEVCTPINNAWGYTSFDHDYKSSDFLVRKLVECVSKGGNMLLNVGPDAYGQIPEQQQDVLWKIGRWMGQNSESIYGCTAADLPRPEWGRYTKNGNLLYAHILDLPLGPVSITGIAYEQIESVHLLRDGVEAKDAGSALGSRARPETKFITFGDNPNYTCPMPDPVDTVLKIKLRTP